MVQLYATVLSYLATVKEGREEGQGMVEYALIISLIAVALIGTLVALKGSIAGVFSGINFSGS